MFIFNTNIFNKNTLRKLAVFGVGLLLGIILANLAPQSASALMTPDDTPNDRAKSYSYWKAAGQCVEIHMRSSIRTEVGSEGTTSPSQGSNDTDWFDLDNGFLWFPGNATTVTVYPDGTLDCDVLMTKALALWGWNDPKQFLKDMGYTFNSNNPPRWERTNDSDASRLDAFNRSVERKVGNVETLFNASAKHDLYLGIFINKDKHPSLSECNATKILNPDSTQREAAENKTLISGVRYAYIRVAEAATAPEPGQVFSYSNKKNNDQSALDAYASVWNYRGSNYSGGTGRQYSCNELVNLIGQNATGFAAWNRQHSENMATPPSGVTQDCKGAECAQDGEPVSSCTIEAIGWIVCPVVNFMAGLADGAFAFLSESFLRTDPKAFNTDDGTYRAWTLVRNLANVMFVVAFLFIIFSQLTGMGVSNYGVKKMLPRIVVAAILVNISFFISQLAIDVSNILGYSINDLFEGLAGGIEAGPANGSPSFITEGSIFTDIGVGVVAIAAGGFAMYALLSTFLPLLLAAVLALVLILFILIARQAIIILLVVLSPLAFVAFLLPNTENLFKQWRKMLTAMLLLFPIISLVFGASQLAAVVLTESFTGSVVPGDDESNFFGQIIGAAVLVLPLFAVPILLKKSLDGIPVLGQMANKWQSKANANLGNKIKESNRGSLVGRGRAIRRQAKENYRTQKFARRLAKDDSKGPLGNFDTLLAGGLAGGIKPITAQGKAAQQAVERVTIATVDKTNAEEAQAAALNLDRLKISQEDTRKLAAGKSAGGLNGGTDFATRSAAIQRMVASNDIVGMNQLWDDSKDWTGQEGDKLRNVFARSLESSGARPAYFGAGAIASMKLNDKKHLASDSKKVIADAVIAGAYSPEKIARADKDELNAVAEIVHAKSDSNPNNENYDASFLAVHQRLVNDAHKALTDPDLSLTLGKNRANVEHIRNGTVPPPPNPQNVQNAPASASANQNPSDTPGSFTSVDDSGPGPSNSNQPIN